DASEPAIAGVIVTLYDADGITVRATAITDGNGAYSFPNLPEGSYVVGFTAPLGFTRTQSVGALNDGLNSDIDASNKTSLITLIAGTYNPNVDAGYYIGVPLPARELVATIAIIQSDNACEVNWYTKDEENTKNFEIERSIDGSAYVKVGTTLASGNTNTRTNYTLNDNIELVKDAAVIYYRIKLIDIDGKSSYSNTINVRPSALNGETVIVYPTPFTDKLMIDYISNEVTDLEIELTDVSGKSIMKKTQTLREGMNHIVVSELHSLSSANYFIRIKDINTGELFIRKVVK
ncbi:MAG TPA: SdrD B-like domain-containing protein, partial [Saccharofermentans sp.]|nr:SdrD B-like domain-containing protein [Saccharofermentans sp.]